MNIIIQGGKSANIPRLLNSSDKNGAVVGQIESNQDGIKACLETLRKQSASTLGQSSGLSCLKVLAGEQYSTKNEPTKLTATMAVSKVLSEINDKSELKDKTLLANAAIMLAKQGKMPKPRQQQVFELATFADEMPKYDAYACLLNNHNQSNENVAKKMLPQVMIDSLREGSPIPSEGLALVEIAVISANAYQHNSESNETQPIRQLLAQDSLLALSDYSERNDSALVSVLAFKHVSSNYLSLSSVASVNQNNPYSGIHLLTNSKGLLSRDAKDHPSPKRDANSILSIVSKSPDSSLFIKKLASSGVLTKGTAKQVLDSLLSHNDLMRKQDSVSIFLKNLELDGSKLEQSDLLEMHKKISNHKYSQPVKKALNELVEQAERLNENEVAASDDEYDETHSKEASPHLSEMRQAHNIYNTHHAIAISDDTHNFAQYTNAVIKTKNAYGEEDEFAFSDFASPAELLSNLELHQVTDIEINDTSKDDLLSADIKAAFVDYVDGVDDRLNLYMTQPVSKSIRSLAGRLGTDEHHLASLHSAKQPATQMLHAVDGVQYTDASVILQADDGDKKQSIPIKEIKSSTDFNSVAAQFIEETNSSHITATLSSSQLNNEFKAKIEELFAESLSQLQQSIEQNNDQKPIVNTHLDRLLCLPASELSDKMKTNTIFINNSQPLEKDGLAPKRAFR